METTQQPTVIRGFANISCTRETFKIVIPYNSIALKKTLFEK